MCVCVCVLSMLQLIILRQYKKFTTCSGTPNYIFMFVTACHWSLSKATSIQSSLSDHVGNSKMSVHKHHVPVINISDISFISRRYYYCFVSTIVHYFLFSHLFHQKFYEIYNSLYHLTSGHFCLRMHLYVCLVVFWYRDMFYPTVLSLAKIS